MSFGEGFAGFRSTQMVLAGRTMNVAEKQRKRKQEEDAYQGNTIQVSSRDAWRTGEAVDRVGENGWNTG